MSASRILVVTSQFPIAGEPTRGWPILQTVQALSKRATVRVVSPVARYAGGFRPRSYSYAQADAGFQPEGCDTRYVHYPTLPLLGRMTNGIAAARSLRQEAAAFAPDLMLGYWLYPDAFAAARLARRLGIPFVAGARGSDLRVRDLASKRLTRPVVSAANRLLVVSEDLGRVAIEHYGADAARVRVVPNGCNTGIYHPRPRVDARKALGIPEGGKLILYVGRLVPEKGLAELMDALSLLPAGPWKLALVGDGPMRQQLRQLAGASPVEVVMPGRLQPEDVATWMAASDVVTLPSYSEGYPNVLVEALASGRPVVATQVGGIPEIVDETCGVLIPPRDPASLANAIASVTERQWDASALARRFARSWSDVADETLEACEQALHEHANVHGG